ncbi:MAG TPA: APC family permease [Candidatus Baltobacteraceae bacterium]|jgi:amino acid transporter|nr:APC family permease [Candidatus Baltobacteraceae bacterium]
MALTTSAHTGVIESQPSQSGAPRKRVLTLWDLIFYGIILIQPIAPVPLFGVAQQLSNGHFATIIMIAMFAMMITAVSYGRMAAIYPSAGSAYTYVGKGLNAHLGFLAGWAMFMDYLLQPLINTVYISGELNKRYVPGIPYAVWVAIIAVFFTALNLLGVRSSARTNKVLLFAMFVVIGAFIVLALHYLFGTQGWGGVLSTQPFYDPATFDWHRIGMATSFAALTYIGFDGVTTLAEDAQNPKRNVLLATVLVCAFTGIFGGLEVYLAQRVWPNWHAFHDLNTAFMDVANRVGGIWLFHAMGIILIIAALGSGLTGGLGAAKLLFGMGRDGVLPRKVFGHVKPGSTTPTYNFLIIGALTVIGAILLNRFGNAYELSAEMLNFGAFLAFMGVNVAMFWQFTIARRGMHKRNVFMDTILPLIGFVFCAWIWVQLSVLAKIVGGVWFAIGIVYLAIKTRGFRAAPVAIDFSEA